MIKRYLQIDRPIKKLVYSITLAAGILLSPLNTNAKVPADSDEFFFTEQPELVTTSIKDLDIILAPLDDEDTTKVNSVVEGQYRYSAPEAIEQAFNVFAERSQDNIENLNPLCETLVEGLRDVKVDSVIADGSSEEGILSITLNMPGGTRIGLISDLNDDLIGLTLFFGREPVLSDYLSIDEIREFLINAQLSIG